MWERFFRRGICPDDDAGRGVGIMKMTGFCGEQKPVFCGRFSFLKWKFLKNHLTFYSICAIMEKQTFCNKKETEE